MKMRWRRIALTTVCFGALAARLGAQATSPARGAIDAVVTDTNLVPLAGVDAAIVGTTLRIVTGANGRFRFAALPSGDYVLALSRDGFSASSIDVAVAAGDTVRLSLILQPAPRLDGAGS